MDDEIRDVVAHARQARSPTPEDRDRIRRRLAVAVAAGAGAAGAGAGMATASASTGLATWVKIGLATVAIGGGGIVAHRVLTSDTAAPEVSIAVGPIETLVEPAAAELPEPDELLDETEDESRPSTRRRRRRPAPVASDDLARDLEALHAAQRAWRQGDARTVLTHVREHQREFPRSQFRQERRALEILALCSLGERGRARQLARRFLASASDSPARRSVLESCAGADE
ncbi:MAG: hypothetical protein R3B99_11540 [Polyangiales bacterium]